MKNFKEDLPVYRFKNIINTESDFIITKDLEMNTNYQNNMNIISHIICEVTVYSTLLTEFDGYELYDYIGEQYEVVNYSQKLVKDQIISTMYVRVPVYM